MMDSLSGIPIRYDPYLVDHVQVRFPRSKKKRIRKKWSKRASSYKNVPRKIAYLVELPGGPVLLMHPALSKEFQRCLAEHNKRRGM